MFIDQLHLTVQSGSGGKGCDSYYSRLDRKTVPDGGDGGRGGSVIIRADVNAPPLAALSYKQHLIAESGGHGGSTRKRGRNGQDLVILVPVGTKIYDRERKFLIRHLIRAGENVAVLEGGKGGYGNQGGRPAVAGEEGKSLDIELVIQLRADIFLIGLPNAGKSSLMNALTRSHIKVESYPFTTVSPEVGVYQKSDYEQIKLCEIPSLYSASHEGRGRGNDFLKHLEVAPFLLYVISPDREFVGSLSEGVRVLRYQLEHYDPKLLKIPYAVIVNKKDLAESAEEFETLKTSPGVRTFFVSVKTGEGMDALRFFLDDQTGELSKRSLEEPPHA